MPIIRSNRRVRVLFERQMTDLSAGTIERIIHNKLADLHWAAGHARPVSHASDGGAK